VIKYEIVLFFRGEAFPKGSCVDGAIRAPGGFVPARPRPGVEDKAGPPRSGGNRRPIRGDFPVSIPPSGAGGSRNQKRGFLPHRIAEVSGGGCWKCVKLASGPIERRCRARRRDWRQGASVGSRCGLRRPAAASRGGDAERGVCGEQERAASSCPVAASLCYQSPSPWPLSCLPPLLL
jgi:hypothetical protein